MLNFNEVNLNTSEPVYKQIVLHVKRSILLKRVEPGERLPSRREIAAQLNVNPNTVQKAFKAMEEEGFVHTSGTLGSVIYFDEPLYARIEEELTREMVGKFIRSAKDVNLSFKKVVDLISELWEE